MVPIETDSRPDVVAVGMYREGATYRASNLSCLFVGWGELQQEKKIKSIMLATRKAWRVFLGVLVASTIYMR